MPVHGEWRHLVANAELAVADRRAARPGRRSPRTAWSSTSSTAWPRSSAPCRAATSTSTAPSVGEIDEALLKDRRILGDEGFISVIVVDRLGDRQGRSPARRSTARGFAEDDAVFDDVHAEIEQALAEADRQRRHRRLRSSQQVMRRAVGGWVGGKHPPPPDDHPGGHRGLTCGLRMPP